MAKVNISTKGGQLSELEESARVQLPTGEAQQATPEPSPSPSGTALDQLMAGPAAQPTETNPAAIDEELDAGIQQGIAMQQEIERQDIAPLHERFATETRTPTQTNWLRSVKTDEVPISKQTDGGITGRANRMVDRIKTGEYVPGTSFSGAGEAKTLFDSGDQVAAGEALSNTEQRPFLAAISRAEGLHPDGTLNEDFIKYGSYITENTLSDLSFGEAEVELDPFAEALGEPAPQRNTEDSKEASAFNKSQGSAPLGQRIFQEWQRARGNKEPAKLPPKEATVLGSTFKDMWAKANPNYVKEIDNGDGPKQYQLTSEGQTALSMGKQLRARLFNQKNVRPAKTAVPKGLPGVTGATKVKKASGAVGRPDFSNTIERARENLSSVPNVVDKQRAKILLSTLLPVLADPSQAAQKDPNNPNAWMATINNIGPEKWAKYEAADKAARRKEQEQPGTLIKYDKNQVLNDLTNKVAQELQSITQERNGANYLSYSVQGFNGRLSPQQTYFNPTTSKAVRFVTRNATPSIAKPNSRVDKNLRQMYAMQLAQPVTPGFDVFSAEDKAKGIQKLKVDSLLPDARDAALTKQSAKLEKWGDQLTQAVSMTDAEYDAVAQAIADGKPLNDPVYQQVRPMEIQDPELVSAIAAKGEDGPHFIDGLIDFAKYMKAKRKGIPYASYFNAYIDGKTNGIASNGIQMGSRETALATGVLRDSKVNLLDAGDIRDEVQKIAIEGIDYGWDGNVGEYEGDLNTVARALYSNRDFNKHTTMTFGYGKEIDSFAEKIQEVVGELAETDPSVQEALGNIPMDMGELSETLLAKYVPALEGALSEEAIKSRKIMRSAASLHAATNQLFSIKSHTGMDLNLGRDVAYDTIGDRQETTVFEDGKKRTVNTYTYETEATSAASRSRTDEKGNVSETPGDYAYGGSLPAPVQSLDAATVAMSVSGKSWDRLKMNSHGNPYVHSIYDAFKADANGFDTVVEEVNKNWLKASGQWSYLQETFNSTKRAINNFREDINKRNPEEKLRPNESVYMDWMLKPGRSKSGNMVQKNLISRLPKLKEYASSDDVWKDIDMFKKNMAKVKYDVNNPPTEPNVRQLKMFVDTMIHVLNTGIRLDGMIKQTNKKKSALLSEIKRNGYKTPSGERIPLQYYAH